ncbi:MAG: M23 family metallopeptidase [Bacteroidia bacterium]
MSNKKRYYYDTETCTYKESPLTKQEIAQRISTHVLASVIGGALLFAGYFTFWDDPKMTILKEQNATLTAEVDTLNQKYVALEQDVDALHKKDNELFRSLLNAQPIEDGHWEGGKGGNDNQMAATNPEVLKTAEKKIDALNYKVAIQGRSYEYLAKLMTENQEKLQHLPAIKPVPGNVISGFGPRFHPVLKIHKDHTGLDFVAPIGTPAAATADGTVVTAGVSSGGYGNQVEIDHGYGLTTKYAHLSEVKVKVGQQVKRGDIIALTGNTGLSSGPHLHYEILKNGTKIDPVDFFYGDLTPKEYEKFKKEAEAATNMMD